MRICTWYTVVLFVALLYTIYTLYTGYIYTKNVISIANRRKTAISLSVETTRFLLIVYEDGFIPPTITAL